MVKRVYWLHAEVFATVVTIFTVINCSDWSLLSHLHLYTVVLIFARKQVFFKRKTVRKAPTVLYYYVK
jgi:hypothetical protein